MSDVHRFPAPDVMAYFAVHHTLTKAQKVR